MKPPRGARLNQNSQFARGLAGFWPINEGAGDVLLDLSPHRNNCTFPTDSADKPTWEIDQSVGVKFRSQIIGFNDAAGQRSPIPVTALSQGHAACVWFYRSGANNKDSIILGGTDGSAVLNYMFYISGSGGTNVNVDYRNSGGAVSIVSGSSIIGNSSDPNFLAVSQDEDGNVEMWNGDYGVGSLSSIGTAARTGSMQVQSICNYDSTSQQRAGNLHFWAAAMWDRPVSFREFETIFHNPWQGIASDLEPILWAPPAAADVTPTHALLGVGV